ncbi:putative nuclease HARBI1 [Daphnia pulex]|uniref:putative nuclease HARBI1 n=1 Tax=Daphnia pulex TaxID=6669 RepID=UPI001EE060C5|nr:putative nuclease HARBI1 [Daphnia pulex]
MDNATDFICWPNRDEYNAISDNFQLPYTICVVDGTLIKIVQPMKHFAAYTCHKKFCAVTLQATCTTSLKFTSVSTGWPGSMHDARVFANSELGQTLQERLAGTDYHLIGDLAYPLSERLLKSYRRAGANEEQKLFNCTLNCDRSSIERAFARLKGKFRRLKFLYMRRLDLIPSFIIAACCLHNFTIEVDGLDDEDFAVDINEEGRQRPC